MPQKGRVRDSDDRGPDNSPPGRVVTGRRLRVPEAAAFLGVAPFTVEDRRWRRAHGIPMIRVGRCVVFDEGALEKYLRDHRKRLGYQMLDESSLATAAPES